jgi:hypothetical protein
MAYGAYIARLWFPRAIGTVSGALTAAAVVGQFALLPLWTWLMARYGWQAPIIGCATLTMAAIAANLIWMREEGMREEGMHEQGMHEEGAVETGRPDAPPPLAAAVGDVVVEPSPFYAKPSVLDSGPAVSDLRCDHERHHVESLHACRC